jgi:hypothetical protein
VHWANGRYVGKVIHIDGHALSLQYHNQKDETIYLPRPAAVRDQGRRRVGQREMKPGEAVHHAEDGPPDDRHHRL